MKKETILIIAGILLFLLLLKKPIKKIMTRGYKNNNFGNIRLTFDKSGKKTFWEGEIEGNDKDFKTFKTPAYGYRAIFILLDSYIKKGFNTIEKIISRYAPSSENNTNSYISTVEKKTGIKKSYELSDSKDILLIVKAISFVENGIIPDENDIKNGYNLFKS